MAEDGTTAFALDFDGELLADGPDAGARHFAFAIPTRQLGQRALQTIRLRGNGRSAEIRGAPSTEPGTDGATADAEGTGRARVRWNAARHPLVVVREPSSGQIISIARGGEAVVHTSSGELELLISSGARSSAKRVKVRGR
jgi:hypothetical protein